MSEKTIPRGEWVEYPDGLKVFYLNITNKRGKPMEVTPTLDLLFLTTPAPDEPILNLQVGERFLRLRVTRQQLYNLNSDIADALCRGQSRRLPNGQMDLSLFDGGPQTEH